MSETYDMEHVLVTLEDARMVASRATAEGLSQREALEHLTAILDDAALVRNLSRLRRRPIERFST
jgi:hypothetical protein